MLPAQLDSIDEGQLNTLVADGVRESRSLEVKAELALANDFQKKEFLGDVSAFANGGGGDRIFGIREKAGAASGVVGLDSFHPDNDTLRIESIVREGIAPHVVGMRVRPVALNNDRWAVIVRIPNSLNRPTYAVSSGVSFRCRQGVSFECRLTAIIEDAAKASDKAFGNFGIPVALKRSCQGLGSLLVVARDVGGALREPLPVTPHVQAPVWSVAHVGPAPACQKSLQIKLTMSNWGAWDSRHA